MGYFDPNTFQNIEVLISLLVILGAVAMLAWSIRRFRAPTSMALILTALTVFVWAASHVLNVALVNPQYKQLFLNLRIVSSLLLPPAIAGSAITFSRQSKRLRTWVLSIQFVIVAVLLALLVTNAQHNLMITGIQRLEINGTQMLIAQHGPVLTAHLAYSLAVLLVGMLLILQYVGVPYLNSLRSAIPLIVGVIAPLLTYFYALSSDTPVRPFTLLALTLFLLVCFTATWIVLTLRSAAPLMKNQVFNSMSQGVLVLDNKLRIVDLNRIVETLIKQSARRIRDREVYELRDNWPQLVQFCLNLPTAHDDAASEMTDIADEIISGEVAYWGGWQQRFFEARSSRLLNHRSEPAGWAIVLTDITEQKRNTRILADEKNRLHLLYTLSQELYGLLTPVEAASKAVDLTVAALGLYMGELSILEKDGETLRVLAVSLQSQEKVEEINHAIKLRLGRGLAGTAAAERALTIWTELGREQKWYGNAGIEVNVRSGAAIPLLAGDQLLGVLTLLSNEQDGIQETDRPLFTAIALPVSLALQNAYRFQEAQRRSEFFEELTNLSDALRRVHNHTEVVETFLDHSLAYFGAETAAIALPTEDGNSLFPLYYRGKPPTQAISPVPIDNSLLGHIFQTGQCYHSKNILSDALSFQKNLEIIKESLGSPPIIEAIHVPLRAEEKVIGVILLQSGESSAFQANDLQMLAAFAEIGGSAMWRAQILETLEQRVDERTSELAEANRQLSELDQLKNEFIASVNHELRTPLTNIKLYLSLLAEGKEERRPKYMEVLQRETGHLTRLLDGSLDLTRLEKARIAGSHQSITFDVRDLISTMVERYGGRIQSKQLEFRIDVPDTVVLVDGNQEQLEQAVANLLENATDYTEQGYVGIEIRAEEEGVRISVTDSGYGIPDNEIRNIWKRFYRGKRVRGMTHAGYGLGLSIVKEIVELHNGRVMVSSVENQGSRFDIILPTTKSQPTNGVHSAHGDKRNYKHLLSKQIG